MKRILGRGFSADTVKKDVKGFPFRITDKDGIKPCVCFCAGGGVSGVCVCVFVCVRERVGVCVKKDVKGFPFRITDKDGIKPCVCVCERESGSARERESVCVCWCMCV